jgi:VCBS repeat-containing protein
VIFGRAVFTPVVEVATVTVTITRVNDAAVINAIGQVDVAETTDTSAIAATIAVTFTDAERSELGHTATLTSTGAAGTVAGLGLTTAELAALITPGAVTKVAGAANGTVTPGFSAASTAFDNLQSGQTVTLCYALEIDDGDGGTTTQAFAVQVTGTNDAPTITGLPAGVAVDEAVAGDVDLSGVTLSDVDTDPVIVTISASSGQLDSVSSRGGLCVVDRDR